MAEDTYEYECMRAELLGIEKPSLDEYLSKQKEKEIANVEQEECCTENLKDTERENEDLKNVSGGLHELSSILSATQKKLNRFKASCGSLTNLLRIKIGNAGSTESIVLNSNSKDTQEATGVDNTNMENSPKMEPKPQNVEHSDQRQSDLARALDNNVDRLDLLIEKAENCQYSMSQQNKQMKKFLN
ncbi:hypothetical protein ILUMI_05345 [Ignelater luminosus]|uniref:Uncharacterized protein n=1 Tax=Ignelater luminosus TaxID=2038154 RepID=A0A8K0DB55_IGNLU|nr:hypothetical protein ILUMI_05345 [Ignelater luminosus]